MNILITILALIGAVVLFVVLLPILLPAIALGTVAAIILGVIGLVIALLLFIGFVTVFALKFVLLIVAAILISIFILSITGSGVVKGIRGDGNILEQVREIPSFKVIHVKGIGDVRVTCGRETSLTVTTDSNLQDQVLTSIKAETLIIETRGNLNPTKGIVIDIGTMNLDRVKVSGAAKLKAQEIQSDLFDCTVSGAASLQASGKCREAVINVEGAAKLELKNLESEKAGVHVEGAASVSIFASKEINADVFGVGKVTVYGKPEVVNKNVKGIGKVEIK